jgi:hypothetical protein
MVLSRNGQTTADFECDLAGKECEVKDSGHPVKLSMWFSGPKLVQLETRGNVVTKRRFSVTGEDDMDVEVIPIVPAGKTEIFKYKRVRAKTAHE